MIIKNWSIAYILIIFFLFVFPPSSQAQTSDEYATIYLYRKYNYVGSLLKPTVTVNKKESFQLKCPGKVTLKVYSEGRYIFETTNKGTAKNVTLTIKKGNEYYLSVVPGINQFVIRHETDSRKARNQFSNIAEKRHQYFEEDRQFPLLQNQVNNAVVSNVPNTNNTPINQNITPKGQINQPTITPDIASNLPKAKSKNEDAIAVVIGNANYAKTKSVDYAINDAAAMKKYLVEVFGYLEGNVFYIENATKGDFELFFGNANNPKGKLYNAVRANISDVFVFYSGHGAPGLSNQQGYFVPVECDPQYVELTGYPLDVFYTNLSKIPAKSMTIVTDACFSGATVYENISPIIIKSKGAVGIENAAVFSSSAGDQVSSWYNEKQHGMLTYFFLKAIHNKNADKNRDNKLTYQEIQNYIADLNYGVPYYARRLHGIEQIPELSHENPEQIFIRF